MKRSLMDHLDLCLLKHSIDIGRKEGGPDIEDVYRLQEMSEVHYHLKVEHDLSGAEIAALARFTDPLVVAVACWEERGSSDAFPICNLLEQINAYERYPTRYIPVQEMTTVVKAVLDQIMDEYQASLIRLEKPELIAKSKEIAAMQEAYDFIKNDFNFQRGDAETLLRMENPLQFVAEHWMFDIYSTFNKYDRLREAIEEAARAMASQCDKGLSAQEKVDVPIQTGKSSLRELLRHVKQEAEQRHVPEKPIHQDVR